MITNGRRSLSGNARALSGTGGEVGPIRCPAGPLQLRRETLEVLHLQRGWMCTCVHTVGGERRIVNLYVPGDHIYLQDEVHAGYSLIALTDVVLRAGNASDVAAEQQRAQSHRTLVERLLRISHGNATQRLSYLLAEIHHRLTKNGFCRSASFEFPVSQALVADMLALSSVHVCRTLKQLREGGYVTLRSGLVEIHDLEGLAALGEFDAPVDAPATARSDRLPRQPLPCRRRGPLRAGESLR
jgi:CRP-like cAMP-binding protein